MVLLDLIAHGREKDRDEQKNQPDRNGQQDRDHERACKAGGDEEIEPRSQKDQCKRCNPDPPCGGTRLKDFLPVIGLV